MNACSRRGHYFIPVRQFGARYAFIEDVDPADLAARRFGWDYNNVIYYAMVLSRLVRDNGYSLEFAARIVEHEDGTKQVIPTAAAAVGTYRLRQDRDWLTINEVEELQNLLAAFLPIRDDFPWRVVHALNVSEDAVHMRIVQRAVLLLGAGLEGLTQTSSHRVSQQFRERLPLLAAEVGIGGFTESLAQELYSARSEAAHGSPVSMFRVEVETPDEPPLPEAEPNGLEPDLDAFQKWAMAQDVIRAAVRRTIESEAFRDVFTSDEALRAKWPVSHEGQQL